MAHSDWPNPYNLLFPSTKGTYLDPKRFEIRLKAVSKRCEIKKVNPHALRHTLATRLVEGNVPLNIVQGILGHASIEKAEVSCVCKWCGVDYFTANSGFHMLKRRELGGHYFEGI